MVVWTLLHSLHTFEGGMLCWSVGAVAALACVGDVCGWGVRGGGRLEGGGWACDRVWGRGNAIVLPKTS